MCVCSGQQRKWLLLGELREMNLMNIFASSKRSRRRRSRSKTQCRSAPSRSGMGSTMVRSGTGGQVNQLFTGEASNLALLQCCCLYIESVYTTNIRDINIAGEDMIQGSTLFLNLNDEGVTPGFVRIPNLIWFQYLRARLSTSPWQGQVHLIW